MEIRNLLQQLGLSEKEISVYLALIDLGPSPVRAIALKSGVNRGTSYDILKDLIAQGLVSYHNKSAHQYFTAEPPEKLLAAIDQKQRDLDEVKNNIEKSLPELKAAFDKKGGRPTMKLYEGEEGIRQILKDVLASFDEAKEKIYYVYSASTLRKNIHQSMPDFSNRRIKKGIKVRTIALSQGGQTVGLDERKWLKPAADEPNATYTLLYAGKVAHISLDNGQNPLGVIIENESIYKTQKLVFESLWKTL